MHEKAKLFQYAVIWHPTEEQAKDGQKSKIVIEPATALAKNEPVASMEVIRKIPTEYADQLDQLDIAIRPF